VLYIDNWEYSDDTPQLCFLTLKGWTLLSNLVSSSISSAHHYGTFYWSVNQRGVNLTDVVITYVLGRDWARRGSELRERHLLTSCTPCFPLVTRRDSEIFQVQTTRLSKYIFGKRLFPTVAAARTAGIGALKRKACSEALFFLLEEIQHGSQKTSVWDWHVSSVKCAQYPYCETADVP